MKSLIKVLFILALAVTPAEFAQAKTFKSKTETFKVEEVASGLDLSLIHI